jgi:iron complex transport system substrate-binding protein
MFPALPLNSSIGPQRIVCLTEETTEWLYLLGQESCIVGISGYTVRPRRAREEKPRVSAFTSARIDKILALQPDCVLGFSDMQADIAAALIRAGVQVTVFNQRSVAEIFSVLYQVAAMVGQGEQGLARIAEMQQQLAAIAKAAAALPRRPKIYFEEWDVPHISAIQWVSELIGLAGGDDIFPELATQSLGKNRMVPRSCGATPTSSLARGAARSFARNWWRRGQAGAKWRRSKPGNCSRSSPPIFCNPVRPH